MLYPVAIDGNLAAFPAIDWLILVQQQNRKQRLHGHWSFSILAKKDKVAFIVRLCSSQWNERASNLGVDSFVLLMKRICVQSS